MRTAIMRGKRLGHESDEQQSYNSWRWVLLLLCGVQSHGGTEGWRFWLRWIFSSVCFLKSNFKFLTLKVFWAEAEYWGGFSFAASLLCFLFRAAVRRETRSYRWRSLVKLPCWSVFLRSCWAQRWLLSCYVRRILVTATSVVTVFLHDHATTRIHLMERAAASRPAVPPHHNVSAMSAASSLRRPRLAQRLVWFLTRL